MYKKQGAYPRKNKSKNQKLKPAQTHEQNKKQELNKDTNKQKHKANKSTNRNIPL